MKFLLSALISLLPHMASAAGKEAKPCLKEAQTMLQAYGITESRLDYFTPRKAGRSGHHIAGYDFWFSVANCNRGSVVIQTHRNCSKMNMYSRGGCEIEGLPYSRWDMDLND